MDAVLILVETIKNPQFSIEKLASSLRSKNCIISPDSIQALFDYHGLTIKKMPKVLF